MTDSSRSDVSDGWARRAPILALAIVGTALAILVWLGQDMTFYHDEYAFILQRDLSLDGLLKPHNEHLSVTLVALYRVLVGTVGTGSYWPYLAVTFLLHVCVAAIVFVVVRREATVAWALGAMAARAAARVGRRRHPVGVPVGHDRGRRGGDGGGRGRAAPAGRCRRPVDGGPRHLGRGARIRCRDRRCICS